MVKKYVVYTYICIFSNSTRNNNVFFEVILRLCVCVYVCIFGNCLCARARHVSSQSVIDKQNRISRRVSARLISDGLRMHRSRNTVNTRQNCCDSESETLLRQWSSLGRSANGSRSTTINHVKCCSNMAATYTEHPSQINTLRMDPVYR